MLKSTVSSETIDIFGVRLVILVVKSLSTAKSPSVTGDLSSLIVIIAPRWLISLKLSKNCYHVNCGLNDDNNDHIYLLIS